jgi:hypothetical protein
VTIILWGSNTRFVEKEVTKVPRYLKLEPSNIYSLPPLPIPLLPLLLLLQLPIFKSVEAFNGITASTSFNYYLSIAILPSL